MAESTINQNQVESQELKRCSKCQIEKSVLEFSKSKSTKDGLQYCCKDCRKEYRQKHKEETAKYKKQHYQEHKKEIALHQKQHYQANKKKILKHNKQYRQNNKTKILKRRKQYRANNKAKIAIQRKRHYRKNRENILARDKKYRPSPEEKRIYDKQYRKKNKEKVHEWSKKYRQTEKGKNTAIKGSHKRRALKLKAGYEDFSPDEILKRDGYICQKCGKKTRPDYKNYHHPLYPNLDHIVPLSKGGAHTRLNTQCLCHQCNMEKNANGIGDQLRMFS